MPYKLVGNCVYKGEKELKCFDTHSEALAYFRALKINVEDSIHEFSMLISKASLYNGEMRWSAVNSDTDWDLYGERMSLELYKSMVLKIKSNVPPPDPFAEFITSEFWKGGMPYLSIAHYSDGNGKAVPGIVRELFIDGNQLKAKGILHNSPLGNAVWKSLKEDEINYKNSLDTDRIRISIAFLDLEHKHGENGKAFKRKAFSDVCPECQRGIGEKIYLDGYLVHLALTRVPVNPRTIMEAEDVMAKKSKPETRKEDAISVLGGDETLAGEVEKSNGLEIKSDVLVEMSDASNGIADEPMETPPVTEPPAPEEKYEFTKSELKAMVAVLVEESMGKKKDAEDGPEDEDEYDKEKMPKKSDTVSDQPPVTKSALELSVDKLYNAVNVAITKAGTSEEKLQEIQPSLEEVGLAIMSTVKGSVGEVQTPQSTTDSLVLETLQAMKSQMDNMELEFATFKAQSTNAPVPDNRVPAPRSISPSIVKSATKVEQTASNPNSVKSIVRRSVGIG